MHRHSKQAHNGRTLELGDLAAVTSTGNRTGGDARQCGTAAGDTRRPGPVGDDWSYETKFDGSRMLVRLESGNVTIFTRNGHDWTDRLPKLADALAHLPVDNVWIDGEAVALDASGKPDFNALQNAFDRRSTGRLVPEAVLPRNRPSVAIPRTY